MGIKINIKGNDMNNNTLSGNSSLIKVINKEKPDYMDEVSNDLKKLQMQLSSEGEICKAINELLTAINAKDDNKITSVAKQNRKVFMLSTFQNALTTVAGGVTVEFIKHILGM